MTDLQIIDLYFARSETAIHETNVKYGRLCTGVAANVLHDHGDVEECVNDTWLTAWNTIPPTRPNKFSAFLCAITRRLRSSIWHRGSAASTLGTCTISGLSAGRPLAAKTLRTAASLRASAPRP